MFSYMAFSSILRKPDIFQAFSFQLFKLEI